MKKFSDIAGSIAEDAVREYYFNLKETDFLAKVPHERMEIQT